MTDGPATFVTLIALATCWVYWREARFQTAAANGGDSGRKAAAETAFIGIGATVASWAYRLYFIFFGIAQVLELGRTANASQTVVAVAFLVLIGGGNLLIERAARGFSVFIVDRRLQLNNASLSMFASDTAKSLLVSAAFALPLVAGWVWLMESGHETWWLAAWALWLVILTIRMLVKPHIETMLFSTAHDLPDGPLRSKLEDLLKRCGIAACSLRVIEASKRTNRVNASVTGLGAHKHIFLYDTLVQRLSAAEIEAVLAHEAGHEHFKHLGKAWAGLGLLGLACAFAIAAALDTAKPAPAEISGLLLAVYPSAFLLLRPLLASISRWFEFQADAFAARQCGASAIEDALRKIFAANHGVWEHHWTYSAAFAGHPSGRERIARLQRMHEQR